MASTYVIDCYRLYVSLFMGPLSIAASVAGLVGLAVQVAPSLQEYFFNVKHAR